MRSLTAMNIRSFLMFLVSATSFTLALGGSFSEDHYCVGSWNIPGNQSVPLIYEGEIVKVSKGTFCTKLHKSLGSIGYLFVDIKYIKFESEGNNVQGLYLAEDAPEYEYYVANKAFVQQNYDNITWQVYQSTLPLKDGSQTTRKVPNNTIIVPINSNFFKRGENGTLMFDIPVSDIRRNLLKLPNPIFVEQSSDKLQDEIVKVYCRLPEFKAMHSSQEQVVRRADLVEVSMIR